MKLNTVIFDMDGLLIDSEPLWKESAAELFKTYGKELTAAQYNTTTGLRTREFLAHWFSYFHLPQNEINDAEKKVVDRVIELVKQKGKPMPGVGHIFSFFNERNFKTGLASSSPPALINLVIEMLGIRPYLHAFASAADLAYGKPHPEVYLQCAAMLNTAPETCLCFEDSYNGMIAAKAAKMKCILVPSVQDSKNPAWEAADLKISTLANFNDLLLKSL